MILRRCNIAGMRYSRRFNQLPREVQDRYIARDLRIQHDIQADRRKAHFDQVRKRWIASNRHRFAHEPDPERAANAAYWQMRRAPKKAA